MSETDASQLLQDIDTAFSAMAYPGDENLVYDNSDTYWDVAKTKGDFRSKHWKELSIDTINYHRDDLPFLTAEAFCFYLPAFLRASVSYPIAVVDVLPDNLMLNLTPPTYTEETDIRLAKIVDILTPQQKKIVLDFIDWHTEKYVPEEIRFLDFIGTRAAQFWKEIIQST